MATNPTASATIPVRLNLLIRIDPAQMDRRPGARQSTPT